MMHTNRRPSIGRLLLILLIKHAFISISAKQQPWHPIRCLAHEITDLLHVCLHRNFDDEFIMNVPDDEAVAEVLHGKTENVPGYTLNDVLDKLRTIAFNSGPICRIPEILPTSVQWREHHVFRVRLRRRQR